MGKTRLFLALALSLMIGLSGCHSNQASHADYCTVKGTVKGLSDGTKLELQNAFNHFEVVGTGVVKQGAFEIFPEVSSPTHVYLYVKKGKQLKDFILEPGTIVVEVDATDEDDYATGASGTVSNDLERRIREYKLSDDKNTEKALKAEVMKADPAGPLALAHIENWCESPAYALEVLDRLSPELARLPYTEELREILTRRLRTEPGNKYLDMEYPDANGNPISLSSVVNNPDNRYVLVDFWATWCDGCVEKIPHLAELYNKYHEKGLEIYGISMDPYLKNWKSYLTANRLGWVNVCEGKGGGHKNSQAWYDYALPGIPTTLLIDCQTGEIVYRDDADLDCVLATLLPQSSVFEPYQHVEGSEALPYRLYRSEKAESMNEAVPLVVFLHGAGERGNDNLSQMKHCIHNFLEDTVTGRYPFLLMVPQCPAEKRWVNTDWSLPEHQMDPEPTQEMLGVMALVDSLVECGAVDAKRIYLCGISMGGFGVWDALQRWPERFAAAIAICGGGDPAYAGKLKDTPIYIFHGMRDKVVMPSRSIQMYQALKDAGSQEAVLVTYPELAHGCWDEAFSTPGLYKWMFDKKNGLN